MPLLPRILYLFGWRQESVKPCSRGPRVSYMCQKMMHIVSIWRVRQASILKLCKRCHVLRAALWVNSVGWASHLFNNGAIRILYAYTREKWQSQRSLMLLQSIWLLVLSMPHQCSLRFPTRKRTIVQELSDTQYRLLWAWNCVLFRRKVKVLWWNANSHLSVKAVTNPVNVSITQEFPSTNLEREKDPNKIFVFKYSTNNVQHLCEWPMQVLACSTRWNPTLHQSCVVI